MAESITILGSTGSIGQSAVRVIESLPGKFRVEALACGSNIELLENQLSLLAPRAVAVADPAAESSPGVAALRKKFPETEFLFGEDGVTAVASRPVDICLSAIVGYAGLKPTVAAIGKARRIALANKETLVAAGEIIMKMVAEAGTELIPVDSEHSAIFMLLLNKHEGELDRVILTASGGSLRDVPVIDMDIVTPDMALNHPTWSMGKKITIDSATLMNKGFEVIEAHHLFGADYDHIDVIIHPQSVIHSMVETIDGAIYAHLGLADMAFPIINALTYPEKIRNSFGRLSLEKLGTMEFKKVDPERYPGLGLCYEAGKRGGTVPAVLNAANEVAVNAFLDKKFRYSEIAPLIRTVMDFHDSIDNPVLDDIYRADAWARKRALDVIKGETA